MGNPLRALIVEDVEADAVLTARALRQAGYEPIVERIESPEAMRRALERDRWDVVLCDHGMPRFDTIAALELLHELGVDVPFIVVSGSIGEEMAVAIMKAGAHDYVMKGNLTRLGTAVEREVREARVRRERREAQEKLKVTEAQLRQAQKMEAIGRLAGGVAHDFNNLLTIIGGYAELEESRLAPGDPGREILREILNAARRGAGLTRQLLAFSRRQVFEPRVVDLNEIVGGVRKMLGRLLGEDVELVEEPAPAPARIRADPGQIEQIVMNLAVNARDAMPSGGTVRLRSAVVDLNRPEPCAHGEIAPGRYATLEVSDTGSGMDPAVRAHLFEPFFTTKEPGKGTGLGLATVYGIVTQSAGHIVVESEVGRGTTFRIFFPRAEAEEPAAPAEPVERGRADRGTETVLVAEDDPAVREILLRTLSARGYTVLQARDGREALEICGRAETRVDLLITDVVMPQLGGREASKRLEQLRPGLKVLYMSGYTGDPVPVGFGRAFLQKPFTLEALARKVREILDG
jgi:signal transduction histidine kinase